MTKTYKVIDNLNKNRIIMSFMTKKACERWLKEGLYGCDGAERDHYADMLEQLDCGETTLKYWQEF